MARIRSLHSGNALIFIALTNGVCHVQQQEEEEEEAVALFSPFEFRVSPLPFSFYMYLTWKSRPNASLSLSLSADCFTMSPPTPCSSVCVAGTCEAISILRCECEASKYFKGANSLYIDC